MKSLTLRIAITSCLLITSNYIFSNSFDLSNSTFSIEQEDQNDFEKEQAKNNPKRNDEAVEMLNKFIKNLEADKEHDKAEALKAMRDYIKKNRKKDTGTTLHEARDEAKKTTEDKDKEKTLKEYIDKIGSAIAKKVFKLNFVARGTGRTTGHIITLSIANNSNHYISLNPELVYVPSEGKYQSYLVYIPDLVTIAPGTTVTLPIPGYCANPHLPPVPDKESVPSPSEWIPINISPEDGFELIDGSPSVPEPMNPPNGSAGPPHHTTSIYVSDELTTPAFDPGMISIVKESPGFSDADDSGEDTEIQITFPGTQEEIGGTIDPEKDPEVFAQIAATGINQIINEVDSIQNNGLYTTPFSNDREKEKEAIIQQTFWIFIAALLGEEYEKEDFSNNVYQQFETATGKTIESLPAEQKKQVDGGITDFWIVYKATGGEAKIFAEDDSEAIPISNPENNTHAIEEEDCCESISSYYCNPMLDFDMKIADQWANATERRKIIKDVKKSMESDVDILEGEAFDEYDISKNPTSATSFWKPGVVGGFASAHAKTWFKKGDNWEWVWGTEKLNTNADGKMSKTLKYDTGDDCRAIVAGTALVRIRASSSAFDAVAGNRHNENSEDQLAFLKSVKYGGKLALEWLILRGRGKTTKTFKNFVKDDLTDQIKGEITDQIEAEVQNLADEHLNEYLKELGLTAEDLSLDNLQLPDLEESLEELLDIDIPTLGDLEDILSEGIEASLNLFFVANTYATADGSLIVKVGGNQGSVRAHTSIHYGREALETTKEAMTWSGPDCQEKIISDVQPNALTISTEGDVTMVSEALSEYGFGNGSAKAYLESMNLQMLVGICIFEENDTTKFNVDAVGSLHWFGNSDSHQENLKTSLKHLENEILDGLTKEVDDFQKTAGNTSLENYTDEMLKTSLDQKIRKWAADNPFYWKDCSD